MKQIQLNYKESGKQTRTTETKKAAIKLLSLLIYIVVKWRNGRESNPRPPA